VWFRAHHAARRARHPVSTKRAEELARANAALEAARDELAGRLGKRTVELAEARRDLRTVRAELRGHFGYGGLIGTSAPMRRLYALMDRVKDTDIPLLITGESGTGKEMVARAVHNAGPRAKRQFIGVNCGAIPANLLESELFGSARGAFTAQTATESVSSKKPMGALSFSMKSARCRKRCKRVSCACFKMGTSARLAQPKRSRSMFAS